MGGCAVACQRRDVTDAVIQGPAKQELLIFALQLFLAEASLIERLFREALHPKRPSQHHPGCRMDIRIEINRVSAIARRGGSSKNAVPIFLGPARSAPQVKRRAHLLISPTEGCRVAHTISKFESVLLNPPPRTEKP